MRDTRPTVGSIDSKTQLVHCVRRRLVGLCSCHDQLLILASCCESLPAADLWSSAQNSDMFSPPIRVRPSTVTFEEWPKQHVAWKVLVSRLSSISTHNSNEKVIKFPSVARAACDCANLFWQPSLVARIGLSKEMVFHGRMECPCGTPVIPVRKTLVILLWESRDTVIPRDDIKNVSTETPFFFCVSPLFEAADNIYLAAATTSGVRGRCVPDAC